MSKTVYTPKPGVGYVGIKGRRVVQGEWVDDPTLANHPSFTKMILPDEPTYVREELPTPVAPVMTEDPPSDGLPVLTETLPSDNIEKDKPKGKSKKTT